MYVPEHEDSNKSCEICQLVEEVTLQVVALTVGRVCLKGGKVTMSRCHHAAQSPEHLQLELGPLAWELSLPA